VPAKRSNSVLCRSDPKAGKRGECLLIRQQRTILLVFGIYGSRRREEEDTVTFVSGCLVKEKKPWHRLDSLETKGRRNQRIGSGHS